MKIQLNSNIFRQIWDSYSLNFVYSTFLGENKLKIGNKTVQSSLTSCILFHFINALALFINKILNKYIFKIYIFILKSTIFSSFVTKKSEQNILIGTDIIESLKKSFIINYGSIVLTQKAAFYFFKIQNFYFWYWKNHYQNEIKEIPLFHFSFSNPLL